MWLPLSRGRVTRRALLLGGAAALAGCSAVVTVRQGLHFFVVNDRVLVRGRINRRTPAAFRDMLDQNPQVRTVVLQSLDGPHHRPAARAAGRIIRARGLDTGLQSDSFLTGGGLDLFMAGTQRTMVAQAQIVLDAAQGADDPARRAYAAEMLGTSAFYEFVLQVAPADGIYTLSEIEIQQSGLLTQPVARLR